MGADLSVPMLTPLSVDVVAEAVQREITQLLNWPEPLPVQVTRTERFVVGEESVPTTILDAADGPPVVFTGTTLAVAGVDHTDIICMTYEEGDNALHALLVPYGKGRLMGGLVLCVACAIALSRLSGRDVDGDLYCIGPNSPVGAEELFEALRCRRTYPTVEDAAQEVLDTIQKYRGVSRWDFFNRRDVL